jgi:hypothetical protein
MHEVVMFDVIADIEREPIERSVVGVRLLAGVEDVVLVNEMRGYRVKAQ